MTSRHQLFASSAQYGSPASSQASSRINTPQPAQSYAGPSSSFGEAKPYVPEQEEYDPKSHKPYSTSMLSQLESQNDEQMEGLSAKVQLLKDVTSKIGVEIRDSSHLLNNLEDTFENASTKLKGTFKRMMIMADNSGIGWRVWLGLFAFIFLCFFFVWVR
ncbi:Protein transport protein [Yarrowia sp. C11]|nr:Protein transport protein [Yarrowia sp. C11]KAG5364030.1 Protein transport protein [Yarrowia sp. E02]